MTKGKAEGRMFGILFFTIIITSGEIPMITNPKNKTNYVF